MKVIHPDQTFSTTAYDALGRVMSKTDQAGKITGYGYDTLGRLTSVTQDVGGLNLLTSYGYDEVGNRVSQTDANNHTTTYQYDSLARRTGRTLPAGQSESYAYDSAGNLKSKTDFNGRTTTYAYDSNNRLLSKAPDASFNAAPIGFTYFANGLRHTMADASGTTTYTYDNRNRLTSKATPFGSLSYSYDAAGNLLTLKSSNTGGISDAYTYDQLNRLSTVTDPSGATTYAYDADGNLQNFTYPNGVIHAYTYDTLNRLIQMGASKNSTVISNYAYALGAAGNRLTVAELSGRVVGYAYDSLYRLTAETVTSDPSGKNGTIGYTYDVVGNRKTLSSTLPPAGGISYTYDADDRLGSDQYDSDGNTTISGGIANTYDFENHLITHGGVSVAYDGDGNRVSESVAGVTTNYLVDTGNPTGYAQVVDELQGGTITRAYSYGLERISQTQTLNATSTTSFYSYDGHGSVRQLTNAAGAVTDTYDYDAFGNLVNEIGSTPNNYLFAGERYDPALGLYYNRARYLNTATGRFWGMDTDQGDPYSPVSLHKYLYASGNPVSNADPSGMTSAQELQTAQGGGLTIDSAADSEDYTALQALSNLIANSSAATPGALTAVAKAITWTLAGLILATSASAPFFSASSGGVFTNYHDPDNLALYAFGNNQKEINANGVLYTGPREPRIGGYNRPAGDADNDLELDPTGMLEPNSPQPWPRGASTWDFPTSASLTGAFWATRTDFVNSTDGVAIKVDGSEVGGPQPAGHRTVYPSVAMTPQEFVAKWFGLGWVKAGTKK
jgi:RHS repeat-associated protein